VNTRGTASSAGYSPDGSFLLTDGQGNEATSGFYNVAQGITSFTSTFTYTVSSDSVADGFDFVVQNDPNGTSALGAGGGSRGLKSDSNYAAIANSVGLGVEMYSGMSNIVVNGNEQDNGTFNVETGDPIKVKVDYSQATGTLSIGMVDPVTHDTSYASMKGVDLVGAVGGTTALVGFTGATGGLPATQSVSNFTFTTTTSKVYTPIALTASSFNQGMIIPKTAPINGAASSITATMDNGTAKTGATFYETGYDPTNTLGTGVPASGSVFVSQADANHTFQMQSYAGYDALLLDQASPGGTITFATPATMSALSFLASTGNADNGSGPFSITINYSDGAPSTTIPYDAIAPDWFNNGPVAWDANGRGYVDDTGATGYDSIYSGNPNLYQVDVPLTDDTDPIESLTLNYDGQSQYSQVAIYAVSGSPGAAVPEPASLGLIAAAVVGLGGRRRRAR
jgi:hypothetical protein